MMKSRNLTLMLLLALTLASCKGKPEGKKEIVFLAPYERQTQIWKSFVKTAQEEFSDTSRYNLHFYYVWTYVGKFWDKREYERDVTDLLARALKSVRKEGVKPDLIVMYGDYISHAAARLDEPMLRETPLLCAGVVYPKWKDLLPMMPNAVVMESRPEVKKNLDFIIEMGLPNYVVTVMDSTYIDDHIREHILEDIGNDPEHYRPNLHLEQADRIHRKQFRDPRTTLIPISTMWPEKNDRHPEEYGGFNFEWIFFTQQQETSFLHIKNDEYANLAMSYNIGPFFTMTPEHFNHPLISALNYCIGGYFTPYHSMWKQLHPIVDKMLSGTPPKQIPWGVLEKDYWLDWRLVKSIHPYASDFPKGVKFVNLPWTERSRMVNWGIYILFAFLSVLFIVFAVIIPSVMSVRQRKQRAMLYEKAREAENSKKQVEYILSELNAYTWRMLPDRTLEFSPSFYRDFNIPDGHRIDYETVLSHVQDPGRETFRELLFRDDFDGELDLEVMVEMPGWQEARAIMAHTISLSSTNADDDDGYHLKAGFFYFNDEAHRRNEELRKAYRRSEEVAEKESFLTSMNDEIQKPVDNIIFFSRLLADHFSELSEQQKTECEEKVMKSNNRLLNLLDEVMGDTAQGRGYEQVTISALKVSDLMEEIYMYHSVSPREDVSLEFLPGPTGSEIEADRPVMIQVMNALITDAFNSCDGNVSIGWIESAEHDVVIFINNSGVNISGCVGMVSSIGGRIEALNFPGSPSRIEISFPKLPPPRGRKE